MCKASPWSHRAAASPPLAPGAQPTLASNGTQTFKGTTYNRFRLTWSTDKSWSGGNPGEGGGGERRGKAEAEQPDRMPRQTQKRPHDVLRERAEDLATRRPDGSAGYAGDEVIDRSVRASEFAERDPSFLERFAALPKHVLNSRERSDLELLANGGFSPLDGFMTHDDWKSVCNDLKLASGLFWPIPITLDVTEVASDQPARHEAFAYAVS